MEGQDNKQSTNYLVLLRLQHRGRLFLLVPLWNAGVFLCFVYKNTGAAKRRAAGDIGGAWVTNARRFGRTKVPSVVTAFFWCDHGNKHLALIPPCCVATTQGRKLH